MKLHHRENPTELARALLLEGIVDPGAYAEARVAECVKGNDAEGAMVWLEAWSMVTGQCPMGVSPGD